MSPSHKGREAWNRWDASLGFDRGGMLCKVDGQSLEILLTRYRLRKSGVFSMA